MMTITLQYTVERLKLLNLAFPCSTANHHKYQYCRVDPRLMKPLLIGEEQLEEKV